MTRTSSPPALTGDALVIEIWRVARRFAGQSIPTDVADDIAQGIVVECLSKIRAEKWTVRHSDLEPFMRGVVRRNVVDWFRRCAHADERNAQHARISRTTSTGCRLSLGSKRASWQRSTNRRSVSYRRRVAARI